MSRLARVLTLVGPIGIVLCLAKLHAVAADVPYDLTNSVRFWWTLAYLGLHLTTAYSLGLPELPRSARTASFTAIGASVSAAFGISLVQLLIGEPVLPRFVVFGTASILVPWYQICCLVADGGRARSEFRDRVVVVGSESIAFALSIDLEESAEKPASVVDVIGAETAGEGMPKQQPLIEIVDATEATVVVLDRVAQLEPRILEQVTALHRRGVRIRTLALFYEEWLGKLPVSELEQVALMFDIGEIHRIRYGRVKRLVDVAVGSLGLLALVAVLPLVVVGNAFGNRGPLFFRQRRVGKSGREFTMLKFRSMQAEKARADSSGQWTTHDDPRVTRFGRLLRKTHVDELPQVLNVLSGSLSVVGPRPEQPHYVEELRTKLPFYDSRLLVRPGLTGWAQVKYGYAGDETDALEKLQYDVYYLRRQGILLDLRIMVRTLRAVVRGGGR